MLGESPRFRIPWRTVSRGPGEADDDFTEAVAASAVGAAGAAATGGIPLSDAARQTLHTIVERYGPGVVSQPLRVEGLLRDLCGECQREIVVLMAALTEDVPEELLAAHGNGLPPKLTLDRLAGRLQENCALPLDTGRWAVTAWAEALGVPLGDEGMTDPTPIAATGATDNGRTAVLTQSPPPAPAHCLRGLGPRCSRGPSHRSRGARFARPRSGGCDRRQAGTATHRPGDHNV